LAARLGKEHLVRRDRRASAADDQVNGALAGVDVIRLRVDRIRRQRVGRQGAPNRVGAFVVMLMSADHEVDAKAVEGGSQGFSRSRGLHRWRSPVETGLMHAQHDPVDSAIAAGSFEFRLEPTLLGITGVAARTYELPPS
jgi:hypothetical protein